MVLSCMVPDANDVPVRNHRWFEHAATRIHAYRMCRIKHQRPFFVAQEILVEGWKQVCDFRYAGVYKAGDVERSKGLAAALGLPQVLLGQPEDQSMAFEAAKDGKAVVSAWIGGGPGLRDYREQDMRRVKNAVLNAMKHLGMLAGEPELQDGDVSVIDGHTVLKLSGERGLTFIDKEKRGKQVKAGEKIGYVKHPYTGDIIQEITAPRDGVMIHGGASWPILPEDATLAILGDPVG